MASPMSRSWPVFVCTIEPMAHIILGQVETHIKADIKTLSQRPACGHLDSILIPDNPHQ